MKFSKLTFVVLLIFFNFIPVTILGNNTIKSINNRDGLSNNSINCIFEDSHHLLWIGTWDGLNQYDGRSFKIFYHNRDHSSISNNIIRQIIEQNDTSLWISTDNGINRWNRRTKCFKRYHPGYGHLSPRNNFQYKICKSPNGDIFCYVINKGFYYYNPTFDEFRKIKIFKVGNVAELCFDRKSHLYIRTNTGNLFCCSLFRRRHLIIYSRLVHLKMAHPVSRIFISNGQLITLQAHQLVLVGGPHHGFSLVLPNGKNLSSVIYERKAASLTYGFVEGGCIRYHFKTKNRESLLNDALKTSIFTLYGGTQNILWVGTDGHGLLEIYPRINSFHNVTSDAPVRCFCEDSEQNILVGTKGEGIFLLNKQRGLLKPYLSSSNGLNSDFVYVMRKNQYQDIFIGTDGKGLCYLPSHSRSVKTLNIPAAASNSLKSVYSILFTNRDKVLWLGTYGNGLFRLDIDKRGDDYVVRKIRQFKSSGLYSINSNIVCSIVPGLDQHHLLIGTRGGGLNLLNLQTGVFKKIETQSKRYTLTSDDILYLIPGRNHSLWAGTGFGVDHIIFSRQAVPLYAQTYTDREGLGNNMVHSLIQDDHRKIWVSTNAGLSVLSPVSPKITNYTARMGLLNNEFCDGAVYQTHDHSLYFGCVNGLTYFNPDEIVVRHHMATLSLDDLNINNQSINIYDRIKSGQLTLDYNEAYIRLGFTIHDFINNENCKLMYRICGYADRWINNENNTSIQLTKLPPGKYVLEVKCTNGDQVWSKNIYQLKILVHHPWWLSTPAFTIYTLLLMILAYSIYRIIRGRLELNRKLLIEKLEKEHQKHINQSKLNFITNITHEFYTPLTLIYGPAQHLLERKGLDSYTKRYIFIIKNNADRMQKLINELMDFHNVSSGKISVYPEYIDLNIFKDYIYDSYSEIAEENQIHFVFNCHCPVYFISDKSALEKIIYNLISNAFKYTPSGGYISTRIDIRPDHSMSFTIRNSGKGLTEKQEKHLFDRFKIFEKTNLRNSRSTGIGLNLTKSLVDFLHGTLEVDSTIGEYVEFRVILPSMTPDKVMIKSQEYTSITESGQEETEVIPSPEHRNITLLVADDENDIRQLLCDILSPYYHVLEASDGEKAFSTCMTKHPDILIADILMPKMDGITLTDQLKSNTATSVIPIIYISAKSSIEDQINAYEHGCELYIPKPFHPRQVIAAVENIIRKYSLMKAYIKSGRSSITLRNGVEIHQDDEQLIDKISKFIDENLEDECLNSDAIAENIGISKAGLYRKTKELTHCTPNELIRTVRLHKAALLLRTTKLTVSEIIYKCGFSSKSYFYKEFAKIYQYSPKDYRNKQQ